MSFSFTCERELCCKVVRPRLFFGAASASALAGRWWTARGSPRGRLRGARRRGSEDAGPAAGGHAAAMLLQAPRRGLAALTAALVRALLPRAARGRWLAARAAAAHAPQRRRAAPARRGPQLFLAEVDPLCQLTHRIPRRRRRRDLGARCCRLAVLARLLVLEMSTFTRLSEVNRPSSSRAWPALRSFIPR